MSKHTGEAWAVGQRAAINRRTVVTIIRVTPSGRAVVDAPGGERTFNADGVERGDTYRRARLYPLTKEIEAEIALAARSIKSFAELDAALDDLCKWVRNARPGWNRDISELPDVEAAERLTAAIVKARGE